MTSALDSTSPNGKPVPEESAAEEYPADAPAAEEAAA